MVETVSVELAPEVLAVVEPEQLVATVELMELLV
jgi:hypothetical protein